MKSRWEKGLDSENLAIKYIKYRKKYKILEHRYKTADGEIDIIAYFNQIIIGIEVKFRKSSFNIRYTISEHQKKRIENCMLNFLKNNLIKWNGIRFDAIFITNRDITYIKNAWN